MKHVISIDVEDFSNGALLFACKRVVPPLDDVIRFSEQMLEILERHQVKATCFFLGEVAEHHPQLVKRVAEAGHEIGVHGWHHNRIFEMNPQSFHDAVSRARSLLQDLSGQPVLGYRAVAMSLVRDTWWACDELVKAGFRYSSSVYPFKGTRYGVPDAPIGAHRTRLESGAELLEIPLTVMQLGPLRLPAMGGGYLRHFPLAYSRWAMRRLEKEGRPAILYLHPYELDADYRWESFPLEVSAEELAEIKRVFGSQLRNRQYTAHKLNHLLDEYSFAPVRDVFAAELGLEGAA